MSEHVTRRRFLAAAPAATALATPTVLASTARPALLGGKPVRSEPFPAWPRFDETDERALMEALRSGKWYRLSGRYVTRFEETYARLMGSKHCLATANGTSALLTSLAALGVQAGDEVIVPPYTFIATVNVVLLLNALPVFVDTDIETFQIDARKIEAAISPRTVAIMPVHLGGSAADMDTVLAVAAKHKLPVVEDACQSHLAEWRGRKVGSLGTTGCFSFQASKNLNSGEGGAILTAEEELAEKCFAFHNNSRSRGKGRYDFTFLARGANLRMTEFQAAILLAQMARLEGQARRREQNAQCLASLFREIPGVVPARTYDGCTRHAYHLFMFRYEKEHFAGLPRAGFVKALAAEGIPAGTMYSPLNKQAFIKNTLHSRGYQAIYAKQGIARWEERNRCPENDKLCQMALRFTQTMLLAERSDMEQIAEAVRKIQVHAAELTHA